MENSELTIKEGYKQTDVGIIPEGWKVEKLENVAPLQRGFDLPSRELKKGVYPVVYSNGILPAFRSLLNTVSLEAEGFVFRLPTFSE